jgi:hypothetical protein
MYDILLVVLFLGLIILALVGAIGYFYIFFSTNDKALEKGLDKPTFVKSVILAGLFLLLGCFAGSALIVLWNQIYKAGPVLLFLSVIVSLTFTAIAIWRFWFSNFLHKRLEKYFPDKRVRFFGKKIED